MALFKKGKKTGKGKKKKGGPGQYTNQEYNEMITPRNDQNMERVEEANEEDLPGIDEQNKLLA
jgi:hypothetical protein